MRIGKVMLISVIVLLLLSACEKSNVNASPEAPAESIVNASTEAPTESIGEESSGVEDDSQKMRIKASFQKIEYNIIENNIDRPAIYAEWVLRTCTYDSDNPYTEGAAICLITLMRVDTEKCVEDKGTMVPFTIRIDQVLVSNGYFKNKSGDIIEASDFSYWFKSGDGYIVNAYGGHVPVAVEGAQYIALIAKETDERIEQLSFPSEFSVNAYTIPIIDESIIPREEIYKKIDLYDDVQKCSEELIEMFIR